jgi:predicted SnoaL-like aldol condensation-catalyzing enzyme
MNNSHPRAFALLSAVVLLLIHATVVQADAKPKNANEATVVSFLDMIFNQKKPEEAFAKYGGPYYRQHNPAAADGKEALIAFLKSMPPGINYHYEFKRVLSDGNMVVVHSFCTASPTDRGSAVIDMFRLEHGKVVEHWDVVQPIPEKSANNNTMF